MGSHCKEIAQCLVCPGRTELGTTRNMGCQPFHVMFSLYTAAAEYWGLCKLLTLRRAHGAHSLECLPGLRSR